MDIIASYGTVLILIAAAVGFFMAYGIGANDVANAMGTSVGSKALTIKQAIFIAMIFEFAGAYLAGGEVTSTIRNGIIDSTPFMDIPELMILGMISALFAAGAWLLMASFLGWPVSTTHSIIGAIIGFALVAVGSEAIHWNKVAGIVGSWIVTPAISGFIAYLIFMSAQKLIFDTATPLKNAKRFVPIYMGLAISRLKIDPQADKKMQFNNVEKVFAVLMVLTACCMAFAHGSNDVANAIGPLAAVVSIVENNGEIAKQAAIAWWILPLGGFGIVAGLAILGKKVIKTIGEGITHLTPSRGFAAELAAASTVVIASGTGLPISTTQTLVGAVLGVGMARGIAALNMGVIRNIVVSWVITLPVGAGLAIVIFYVLRTAFGV